MCTYVYVSIELIRLYHELYDSYLWGLVGLELRYHVELDGHGIQHPNIHTPASTTHSQRIRTRTVKNNWRQRWNDHLASHSNYWQSSLEDLAQTPKVIETCVLDIKQTSIWLRDSYYMGRRNEKKEKKPNHAQRRRVCEGKKKRRSRN